MLETQSPKKFAITPWMVWLALMGLILLSGVAAGLMVFWKGLGITNLTDQVPWALWITIDLSSIALGAGAFSMCAAVYLFGLKRYQPIARTATFVGLIGYTMAMLALLLDIGRPDRFWHSLVYWNKHSLLWEVTMCVVLYLTVLLFESMPIAAKLEWLRKHMPKVAKMMSSTHHYAPILAIIGLGLSSLHQSSLGAIYGVIKARPFWFKPEMSVLFMLSAIVGGISLTLFVTMLSSRLTRKAKINDGLIERVAQFVAYLLIAYGYFRFWDALSQTYTYDPGRTEGLLFLTKGPFAFNFWVVEMLFGDPHSDDPAALQAHTDQPLLAHGCPVDGCSGRGCLPLGYQHDRPAGDHAVCYRPAHHVHELPPIAGRNSDRRCDHCLWAYCFLDRCEISKGCGSYPGRRRA